MKVTSTFVYWKQWDRALLRHTLERDTSDVTIEPEDIARDLEAFLEDIMINPGVRGKIIVTIEAGK